MRETWTDERLDDLKDGMHREFDQVHREFGEVRAEIRELRAETNSRFDKVDARFEKVDARFDSLNRTLYLGWGSIIVTLIGAVFAKGVF